MNNYRILKNGEKAQELETAMEIIIKTKCPTKWIVEDLETGQRYRANGNKEIGKMFTDYMNLTQDMFEKIDFLKSMGLKYEFNIEKGDPVEGVPTHRFSMKMDVEEADPSLFPTGLPHSNMAYLYAVTNGHYVVAMDKEWNVL